MRLKMLVSLGMVAGLAASANAETILSFGFTDLSGGYNNATQVYTVVGVNTTSLKSGGNVNRHLDPVVSAIYNPGSAAGLVSVSLDITNIVGTSASGSGSLFIEDANGDRFVADISGTFTHQAPAIFFNGILNNINFVAAPGSNNMFDGPSGGSFPLNFDPAQPPLSGAAMLLSFDHPGGFFGQNFQNSSTQLHGAVIPAPGTLALLGLGGFVAARRRRLR